MFLVKSEKYGERMIYTHFITYSRYNVRNLFNTMDKLLEVFRT